MIAQRAKLMVVSSIAVLVIGISVAHCCFSESIPADRGKPLESREPLTLPPPDDVPAEFEIQDVVAKVWIPEADDVVDAMGYGVDVVKCWVVKFTPITPVRGNFAESSLNVLVHSPSQDLGVRRIGQTVTLRLNRSHGPVTVLVPPGRSTARFPDISKVRYRVAGR